MQPCFEIPGFTVNLGRGGAESVTRRETSLRVSLRAHFFRCVHPVEKCHSIVEPMRSCLARGCLTYRGLPLLRPPFRSLRPDRGGRPLTAVPAYMPEQLASRPWTVDQVTGVHGTDRALASAALGVSCRRRTRPAGPCVKELLAATGWTCRLAFCRDRWPRAFRASQNMS